MLESNFYWLAIVIITGTIELSVLKFILDESSELKNSKLIANLSLIIPIIIAVYLSVNIYNIIFKLAINVSLIFLYYKFNYNVKTFKCIFIVLLYTMLIMGVNTLASSAVIAISSISSQGNILLENNFNRLGLIILSKSLLLLFIPIIKSIKLTVAINKKEYIYIIIPILANIIIIAGIINFVFEEPNITSSKAIKILIISLVLFLSNISLIVIISKIINDFILRNKVVQKKSDLEYKYYLNLHQTKFDPEFNTQNVILDVLLNDKKFNCDKSNIKLIVDVNFSKCDFIEIADVCNIFSNILDNSIEACEKIKDKNVLKNIKLYGNVVNKFYVIKCNNSVEKRLNPYKNKLVAEYPESNSYGININSIKKSIQKYNGEVVISSADGEFIMTILIPLTTNLVPLDA